MKTAKITITSIVLLLLASFSAVFAQESDIYMPSGRPGYTTGASVVADKSLLLETGFGIEKLDDYKSTTINTSTLRYGISNKFEARFSMAEKKDDWESGISAIAIGAKYNLTQENGKLTLMGQFDLPCGKWWFDLGYTTPHFSLAMLYSKPINDRLSLTANVASKFQKDYDHNVALMAALSAGYSINDKLSASAEIYCNNIMNFNHTTNIGVALAYQVLPRLQFDVSTTRTSDKFVNHMNKWWSIEAGICWLIK